MLKYAANCAKEIKTKVSRNFINIDRHIGQYVEAINRFNEEVAQLKAKLAGAGSRVICNHSFLSNAKSKLLPASTYPSRILCDIDLLSSANAIVTESGAASARETLWRACTVLSRMQKGREGLEDALKED